jgi:hypothetical protein
MKPEDIKEAAQGLVRPPGARSYAYLTIERVSEIRSDLAAAIAPVAKKHGMVLIARGSGFDQASMSVPFKLVIADATAEEVMFRGTAHTVGLTESDYGRVFRYLGKRYRAVAIKRENWKYPLIAERIPDGRRVRTAPSIANQAWEEAV